MPAYVKIWSRLFLFLTFQKCYVHVETMCCRFYVTIWHWQKLLGFQHETESWDIISKSVKQVIHWGMSPILISCKAIFKCFMWIKKGRCLQIIKAVMLLTNLQRKCLSWTKAMQSKQEGLSKIKIKKK